MAGMTGVEPAASAATGATSCNHLKLESVGRHSLELQGTLSNRRVSLLYSDLTPLPHWHSTAGLPTKRSRTGACLRRDSVAVARIQNSLSDIRQIQDLCGQPL